MKNLLKYKILVFASCASLVACGGWSQDPLAKAKGMGQGKGAPDTKPKQDPLDMNYITLDAPLFKLGKEGEQIEIKIDARVSLPGYTLEVGVKNLAQFAGATFDAPTNTFKWTPAAGTANSDISEFELQFSGVATAPGKVAVLKERVVMIGVTRLLTEPTITEVTSAPTKLREGESHYLYVTVEDQTASGGQSPTLNISSPTASFNLAPFVEVSNARIKSAKKFEFTVTVDLIDAEITKDSENAAFDMAPVSFLGKAGAKRNVQVDVFSSLSDVVSMWTEEESVQAVAGARFEQHFVVFDPKQEGKVELYSTSNLPTGSSLECDQYNNDPNLSCKFTWENPVAGYYSLQATFKNASNAWGDSYDNRNTLRFPLQVKAAGSK